MLQTFSNIIKILASLHIKPGHQSDDENNGNMQEKISCF